MLMYVISILLSIVGIVLISKEHVKLGVFLILIGGGILVFAFAISGNADAIIHGDFSIFIKTWDAIKIEFSKFVHTLVTFVLDLWHDIAGWLAGRFNWRGNP